MITAAERYDLINIMKTNRLALADSDSAQLEFAGMINGRDYRVKILTVEDVPHLVVRADGEVICNEFLPSVDELKIFLDERLYQFTGV